jgi:hypothetical protein
VVIARLGCAWSVELAMMLRRGPRIDKWPGERARKGDVRFQTEAPRRLLKLLERNITRRRRDTLR